MSLKLDSGGKTEIIYGIEEVTRSLLQFFSNAQSWFGIVANSEGASVAMKHPSYLNAYDDFVNKRGGKPQWITEVIKDNLPYIKKLMKYAEVRHLDNIKGSAFGISETEYVATEVVQEAQPLTQLTYSNIKVIVEQQHYLFQILWDKAIPAEQKIKEIEEGIEPPQTEVIHGLEQSISHIISFWNGAKTTMNIAADLRWPILAIQEPRFWEIVTSAHARNIRIRVITDITKDNIKHCKQLTQYCELYHSERMKSNLAVSDTEYVSWSNIADDMQNLSFVHSNEPEIVEQHRYLFESLLSKALPAELKIREIEEGIEHEKTEVIIGAENVANVTFPYFANADKIDVCLDSDGPTLAMQVEAYRKLYSDFKESGRKMRFITEITKDNLVDCKELMKRAEVRHLDAVRGNFTTSHKEYLATSIIRGIQPIPLLIYSNFPEIVAQNQYLFDTLWNKAIPAEQRIREIEEGIPVERTEVISDPHATENLYKSIVGEAEQEIMLILPTVNAFARQKRIGIIDFLKKLGEKGVKIRMLIPAADKENRINEQDISDLEACGIQVNQLSVRTPQEAEGGEGTKVSAVIVDKRTSLVIELKNDDEKEESFAGAIGSAAVHSTGKALASSYARIFESLWQETRLATQLKESEEMQREFINIAAHELRTPIQPILGASELMKFEFEKGSSGKVEVTKEDIEIIIRNAGRLERLSSDILELARIGSGGRLNLHKSRFNIGEIMSKAIIDAKAQIVNEDKRNIKLHYDESNEDTVFVVYADKGRISQVINNLLSNAIKFTHKGGGDIYLMTKKDRDNNNNNNSSVIVTVKDTGTGLDPEIMPRLFTKFATKSAKGTGLGLYLSKNIIEAHGGKIWAENNNNSQGNGATFTFVLPLAEEEELRR